METYIQSKKKQNELIKYLVWINKQIDIGKFYQKTCLLNRK